MPLIIKLMNAHSLCRPIFINANRIWAIYDDPYGTTILFARDSKVTVRESSEQVAQIIQEAVAAIRSQESPTHPPASGHSTPEEDMPIPSEGCVCGIHPHFDNDESDSLP